MLAENIKSLRKSKGMTQEELAIRLNVVRQTVSKWEKAQSVPDAALLQKLADVFETDVSTLLGGIIEPNNNANSVAEQLARINEQLIIRNKRSRTIWTVIGISVLALILVIGVIIAIQTYEPAPSYADSPNSVWEGTEQVIEENE